VSACHDVRVKRLLSALILVLVLVPLMLLMRWGGEAKGPWSAPRDGVQARLVSPRFLWRADEDVTVAVRLRNRSTEARDIRPVALLLTIRREGLPVGTEEVQLRPAVLPAGAEIDLPVLRRRLDDGAPGLRSVEGSLEGSGLPALKLRVVKAR
jgi:hypothetical protein